MNILPIALSLLSCQDYGYTEKSFSEVFHQEDVETTADILFIIDDSPSMAEEQELLGVNFEAFVDAVESTYADYQVGIITTDVSGEDAGMLRGELMGPDTDDLATVFLETADVGSYGSRDERGFEAMQLAIDGRNPGLIRAGAKLHVVVLSDEDDHSPLTEDEYITIGQQGSGNGSFSLHAIVGDLPDGCASGTAAASPGTRYLTAALVTEGYRDSICAQDYTEILKRIGLDLSLLSDTFYLTDLVEPASLQVWVDGVIMLERERDGWTYSGAENAIVFDGYAVPRPGMEIVVYYEILEGRVLWEDTGDI